MSTISVSKDFSVFCDALSLSDEVKKKIELRKRSITKSINSEYWHSQSETDHCMIVGSHGRGTGIYTSDIDMIVELPWSEYSKYNNYAWNGQSSLLQAVKQCVQKTYARTDLSGDGQVVDAVFSDSIKFEIVPAFRFDDGSYYYPDTNNGGSWKSMDPQKEILMFSYYDALYGGNLRNLCRMARAWKEKMNVLMPGILIDTIACYFLNQYKYAKESFSYYDWMSRDFFSFVVENDSKTCWSKYWSDDTVEAKYAASNGQDAKKAYLLSLEALDAGRHDYSYTWHSKWREIYGSRYPEL